MFDDWYTSIYNLFFTSLPVLVVGVLDQEVPPEKLLKMPALYSFGQLNRNFNLWTLGTWMFDALVHSLMIYFFAHRALAISFPFSEVSRRLWEECRRCQARGVDLDGCILPGGALLRLGYSWGRFRPTAAILCCLRVMQGWTADIWSLGTTVYTILVTVANARLGLSCTNHTVWHLVTMWGSVAIWWLFVLIYNALPPGRRSAARLTGARGVVRNHSSFPYHPTQPWPAALAPRTMSRASSTCA